MHDFSTLYTNLRHEHLKNNLDWFIDSAYKGSKREYISVYSNNARFTGKPRESTTAFKSQDLKKLTHYLIDNAMSLIHI